MKKKKKKKDLKKEIAIIAIPLVILAGVVLAVAIKSSEIDKKMVSGEIKLLDFYSEQEAKFLEDEGFLTASVADKINEKITENQPIENQGDTTKKDIAKILKPPTLIEQSFDSAEEGFEVLATQLDINNNVYKMAFKLENRSSEQKNFFLLPIFHQNQAVFKGVKGLITDVSDARALSYGAGEQGLQLLAELYDINQHFNELRPELAQAYLDIRDKNYEVQPIEAVVLANSAVIAQAEWDVLAEGENPEDDSFESVYLLVYGSAGGARDELTILSVGSYIEENKKWVVDFFTRAISDLYIGPANQATLDDGESVSLFCGDKPVQAQMLEGNIVYFPEWSCFDVSRVVFSFQKEDSHILRFVFGNEEKYAFNGIEPEASQPAEAEEPGEEPVDTGSLPAEELPDEEPPQEEEEQELLEDGTLPPEPETPGCNDSAAENYNPEATVNDGSCQYPEPEIQGCTDPGALNYNSEANTDDGGCEYPEPEVEGCTDSEALNYNSEATVDDGSCEYPIEGCTDPEALNYNSEAAVDDDSCEYEIYGCTDSEAENYNPEATIDDGGCLYAEPPAPETPPATDTDSPQEDGLI